MRRDKKADHRHRRHDAYTHGNVRFLHESTSFDYMVEERANTCPPEEALIALVAGEVAQSQAVAIRAHVDVCERCRVALAEAARDMVDDLSPDTATLGVGDRVADRYVIVRLIGRGGMGDVYEAEDTLVGDHVALKTVTGRLGLDPLALWRLKREVRLARRVTSPNVCRILDFGLHRTREGAGGARPFLTMELLKGGTLADHLAGAGGLPERFVAHLARELLEGLRAIHEAGIVHRDIKPENVFLIPGGDLPRAVIMDLGLARSLDPQDERSWTTGRHILGTPEYIAPEQLEGRPVGPATDLYSLAVTLFKALTGRAPFSGDSPAEVATKRLYEPPARLASFVRVSPGWQHLLDRALAREAVMRFASAAEMLAALDGIPLRPPRDLRRWWAFGALAVSGTAAALVAASWQPRAPDALVSRVDGVRADVSRSGAAPRGIATVSAPPAQPDVRPHSQRRSPQGPSAPRASRPIVHSSPLDATTAAMPAPEATAPPSVAAGLPTSPDSSAAQSPASAEPAVPPSVAAGSPTSPDSGAAQSRASAELATPAFSNPRSGATSDADEVAKPFADTARGTR